MDAARRRRFREWFGAAYGEGDDARTKFIADSGKHGHEPLTKGRVSQLFDESQPFGERAARSLGERFGLDAEFFLTAQADDASTLAYLAELRKIDPEQYALIVEAIERITTGARAARRLISTNTAAKHVTPERAAETLGKARRHHHQDAPNPSHEGLLGTDSEAGVLGPAIAPQRPRAKR